MTAATLLRLSPPTAAHLHASAAARADSPQSPVAPQPARPPAPPPTSLSSAAASPNAATPQSPSPTRAAAPIPPPPRPKSAPPTAVTAPTSPVAPPPSRPSNLVLLNVYDVLTPSDATTIPRLNDVLFPLGVGVFHTGVEVWGREFAYGGHPDSDSGIFEVPPRKCPAVRFRMTLPLGTTRLSERAIERVITALGVAQFAGNRYSLISRNCNTFSKTFAALLGVKDNFPAWVNRLATIAVNVKCILPEAVDLPLSAVVPAVTTVKEPRKPPRVATMAALAPSTT